MARGYVYVLANSSMPGLVKVGKTQRETNARANELSGVTGVPTPFIVVYEQLFSDCDEAERFVHALLSSKGHRISESREFFKAPVSEVVSAVVQAHQKLARNYSENDNENGESDVSAPPWKDVWEQAEASYYGLEDQIESQIEAEMLYKEAIKLGCKFAYHRLGDMYFYGGDEIESDDVKAMRWYKQGAANGMYLCHLKMAENYAANGSVDNVEKCLNSFCRDRASKQDPELESQFSVMGGVASLLAILADVSFEISGSFREFVISNKEEILFENTDDISRAEESGNDSFLSYLIAAKKWILAITGEFDLPSTYFKIDEFFFLPARKGSIAVGRIMRGALHVGMSLSLSSEGERDEVKIIAIEKYGDAKKSASEGDHCGVEFIGVPKESLKRRRSEKFVLKGE